MRVVCWIEYDYRLYLKCCPINNKKKTSGCKIDALINAAEIFNFA